MDWEGKIVAPHLTCAVSGRTLAPGEALFSGLLIQDGVFARLDFSTEVWEAQDKARFLSWWRQKVPSPGNERRAFRLNAETLVQIFANLKDSRSRAQQCLAYVVVLGLVRARKLHFLAVKNEGEAAFLLIEDRASGVVHRVRDPGMSADEEKQVLNSLLSVTGIDDQAEADHERRLP